MLTVEQTMSYFDHTIAAAFLAGDASHLRQLQTAAGVMMAAATANNDPDSASRFRFVAAEAANRLEELDKRDD